MRVLLFKITYVVIIIVLFCFKIYYKNLAFDNLRMYDFDKTLHYLKISNSIATLLIILLIILNIWVFDFYMRTIKKNYEKTD